MALTKTKEQDKKETKVDFMEMALQLGLENKLKMKVISGNIYIDSVFDSWYILDCDKYVALHHKNTLNKNYHLQRRFSNPYQAVDSIIKHDRYVLNK